MRNKIILYKYITALILFNIPINSMAYESSIISHATINNTPINRNKDMDYICGVTIDEITNLPQIINALKELSCTPTTRIVFDQYVPAKHYSDAINQIHNVSYILGQISDSVYIKTYSLEQYKNQTTDFLNYYGDIVDIWEIGNEVNGEWTGNIEDTRKKIISAYKIVKSRNKKAAITFSYFDNCPYIDNEHKMFNWIKNNIPDDIRNNLDYAFISYYEDIDKYKNTSKNGARNKYGTFNLGQLNYDQDNYLCEKPDWNNIFDKLQGLFPNSKLGFGEIGTDSNASTYKKKKVINQYYRMDVQVKNYVGGYFWWYFLQDMVPNTKPLWHTLNKAMATEDSQ